MIAPSINISNNIESMTSKTTNHIVATAKAIIRIMGYIINNPKGLNSLWVLKAGKNPSIYASLNASPKNVSCLNQYKKLKAISSILRVGSFSFIGDIV